MRNEIIELSGKRETGERPKKCVSLSGNRPICFQIRRTHNQYDASFSNDPDYSRIGTLDPFLDGRSGSLCSGTHPYGVFLILKGHTSPLKKILKKPHDLGKNSEICEDQISLPRSLDA